MTKKMLSFILELQKKSTKMCDILNNPRSAVGAAIFLCKISTCAKAVPGLAARGVESLTVFQRTPCWAPPRLDFPYPQYIKSLFALVPFTNTIYRQPDQLIQQECLFF
jgi:hypothetical protein